MPSGTDCSSSMAGPSAGHSGMKAWGTKLNSCYSGLGNAADSCTNADTNDDSVLTAKVVIPSGWSKATLSWWEWYDVFLSFDWSEIRVNGSVVNQRCSGSHTTPTAWVNKTVDLTPYVGQTITITFHFMATTVVNYAGWYIDDLSVTQ